MMRKKILCVDDSNVILLMEKLILAKAEYDLITAATGSEAVEKARRERPDLILLDVVMPVMDGFEACRHLRTHDETRDIPIIMVTTRAEASNVEKGYLFGCNDYITKPIDSVELLTKVKNYLGELS
ncbi:MAG TPA: response regulator [Thermoanaerobaculia bacterium]|nr:response regulator [Thermoanaerobaculia bacterium]